MTSTGCPGLDRNCQDSASLLKPENFLWELWEEGKTDDDKIDSEAFEASVVDNSNIQGRLTKYFLGNHDAHVTRNQQGHLILMAYEYISIHRSVRHPFSVCRYAYTGARAVAILRNKFGPLPP